MLQELRYLDPKQGKILEKQNQYLLSQRGKTKKRTWELLKNWLKSLLSQKKRERKRTKRRREWLQYNAVQYHLKKKKNDYNTVLSNNTTRMADVNILGLAQ